MNLYGQSVCPLHDVEKGLLVLLEFIALTSEVLDDFGRTIYGDESGNVVDGRVVCEKGRVWRS